MDMLSLILAGTCHFCCWAKAPEAAALASLPFTSPEATTKSVGLLCGRGVWEEVDPSWPPGSRRIRGVDTLGRGPRGEATGGAGD